MLLILNQRDYFRDAQKLFLYDVLQPNNMVAVIFSNCLDRLLGYDVRCYAYFSWIWIFKMFPIWNRSCMWYCLRIFWKTPKCSYDFSSVFCQRAQTRTHFAPRRACRCFSDHCKAERVGVVQPREEKAPWRPYHGFSILKRGR